MHFFSLYTSTASLNIFKSRQIDLLTEIYNF
jgi:hypothetical protein